jgi:hypothetical protein
MQVIHPMLIRVSVRKQTASMPTIAAIFVVAVHSFAFRRQPKLDCHLVHG